MSGLVPESVVRAPQTDAVKKGGGLTTQNFMAAQTAPLALTNSMRPRPNISLPNRSTADYDENALAKNLGHSPNYAKGEHGGDTYKQPNHPTFSNQAELHNSAPGVEGGTWNTIYKAGGSKRGDVFRPSPFNLVNNPPKEMANYFRNHELSTSYVDLRDHGLGIIQGKHNGTTPYSHYEPEHAIEDKLYN
jgi:hypothetical protein